MTGSGAANYASAVTQTALYAGDPNSNPSAPLVYHAVNYVNPPYQGVVYPPSPLPVPNGTSQVFSLNLATGWAVMGVGSAQVSGFEADFLVSTASTTPEPATLVAPRSGALWDWRRSGSEAAPRYARILSPISEWRVIGYSNAKRRLTGRRSRYGAVA